MKKTPMAKLDLHRETLARLTNRELDAALGGQPGESLHTEFNCTR